MRRTRVSFRLTLGLVVGLTGSAVACSQADAYVYWVNGSGASATIARANNDGTGVNTGFIPSTPNATSIAVNGTYIFWTDSSAKTIGRAAIAGTGVLPSLITGQPSAALAADATHLYFTNQQAGTNHGRISVAGLDGLIQNAALVTEPDNYSNGPLAVGPGYLYRGRAQSGTIGSIGRTDLAGGGDTITNLGSGSYVRALAATASNVYGLPGKPGTTFPVGVADLGPGAFADLVPGDGRLKSGLAQAGCRVFWSTAAVAASGGNPAIPAAIERAGTDGTDVRKQFITAGVVTPGAVAADLLPAEPTVCVPTTEPVPVPPTDPPVTTTTTSTTPTTPTTPTPPTTTPLTPEALVQAQLDQLTKEVAANTAREADRLDDPFATQGLSNDATDLNPFGGGLGLLLTYTACTTNCLVSPGGTPRSAGTKADALLSGGHDLEGDGVLGGGLLVAAKASSNVIGSVSFPSVGTQTKAQLDTRIAAQAKLLAAYDVATRQAHSTRVSAKRLTGKRKAAATKKLRALTKRRKAGITSLAAVGFHARPLTPSKTGRKVYKTLRKRATGGHKATFVLQIRATDPATGLVSVASRTVRLHR